MSYATIWECSQDRDLRNRVAVCVQAQDIAPAGAESWVTQNMLAVATTKAIADAWEHSMVANPYHSRRGHDPVIITDQMITDAVQKITGPAS